MMNYRPINSSTFQVRTQAVVHKCNHGFQKSVLQFLKTVQLPQFTYQIIREELYSILSKFPFYTWSRPSYCRPMWFIVKDDSPCILMDIKNPEKMFTTKIPIHSHGLQSHGPIIGECYYDHQDRKLYVFDVMYMNQQNMYETKPYHERYNCLKTLFQKVLVPKHPSVELEIIVPKMNSIESILHLQELDPALALEFQPDIPGKKRFIFLYREESRGVIPEFVMRVPEHMKHQKTGYGTARIAVKNTIEATAERNRGFLVPQKHTPRQITPYEEAKKTPRVIQIVKPEVKYDGNQEVKYDTKEIPSYQNKNPIISSKPKPTSDNVLVPLQKQMATNPVKKEKQVMSDALKKCTEALCKKDTKSKLTDCYVLYSKENDYLGLASLRKLDISLQVRDLLAQQESIYVQIRWHEPFEKFEIIGVAK